MNNFIKENKIIISIFLLALSIRILFVFVMPVKLWDETVYTNLGYDLSKNLFQYSFTHGWSDFIPGGLYPKAGFRAPFLPYLLSAFYFLKLKVLINFIMPLIGALSVIILYLLGKEIFNKKVGLISSLIFAFIPLHVFYSGRILTNVLFTFFVLLTFLSFWKGYEKGNKNQRIFFGIFLALALLSRYTALWIIPVFFIYLLIKNKSFKFLKERNLWISILAFFITLTPWLIYGILEYGNPLGAFIHGAKAAAYWGGTQGWTFFFSHWWSMFSIIGFIFIGAIIWIFYKKEYSKKKIYLLLIWFYFFLIMAIFMPHKEERFLLAIVPPVSLISGYFINKFKSKALLIILGMILILFVSLATNFYNTSSLYHNTNTECFKGITLKLQEFQGNFMMVSENPPLFRDSIKQESDYYPDTLNEKTLEEMTNATSKKVYFIFTKFNSGFETEKWKNLKVIMGEKYTLEFECPKDPEVNWIYSAN